jgi:hypothetical protein
MAGFQADQVPKIGRSARKISPPSARKSECQPLLFTFFPVFREPPKDVFTRYGSRPKCEATRYKKSI